MQEEWDMKWERQDESGNNECLNLISLKRKEEVSYIYIYQVEWEKRTIYEQKGAKIRSANDRHRRVTSMTVRSVT